MRENMANLFPQWSVHPEWAQNPVVTQKKGNKRRNHEHHGGLELRLLRLGSVLAWLYNDVTSLKDEMYFV